MDTNKDAEELLLNTASEILIRNGDSLRVEKAQKFYRLSHEITKIISQIKELKEAS